MNASKGWRRGSVSLIFFGGVFPDGAKAFASIFVCLTVNVLTEDIDRVLPDYSYGFEHGSAFENGFSESFLRQDRGGASGV